jgi:hypothetical protein
MWKISLEKLGKDGHGATVTFITPGGHSKKVEGNITDGGYVFTMEGGPGELQVEHAEGVEVEFEVLKITED